MVFVGELGGSGLGSLSGKARREEGRSRWKPVGQLMHFLLAQSFTVISTWAGLGLGAVVLLSGSRASVPMSRAKATVPSLIFALKVMPHPLHPILHRILQMLQESHKSAQGKGEEKQRNGPYFIMG